MRRFIRCIVAALVIAYPATHAKSQASDDTTAAQSSADERARVLFDEGVRLVEAGERALGLARFEEAFALSPRASTAYNMAWVLYAEGRVGAALLALNRADVFPMTDAERAAVDALRVRMRPDLTTVVVEVTPADATVCVDDVCDSAGTRVRTLFVEAGTHRVRGTATNVVPLEQSVTTRTGATTRVVLTLAERPPVLAPIGPRPALEDTRTSDRRRVRRAAWLGSSAALTIAAVVLVVWRVRADEPASYSGIDFGARP